MIQEVDNPKDCVCLIQSLNLQLEVDLLRNTSITDFVAGNSILRLRTRKYKGSDSLCYVKFSHQEVPGRRADTVLWIV